MAPIKPPVLVTIIAVLLVLKAILLLPGAVTTLQPYTLMGMTIGGQAGQAVWIAYLLIYIVLAFGLLRLQEWARIGTVVLFVFAIVNFWIINFLMIFITAGGISGFDFSLLTIDWKRMGIDLVYTIFTLAVLFKYRTAFKKANT